MGSLVQPKMSPDQPRKEREGMVIVYTYLILCDVTANDVVMRHEAPKRVIVSPWVKPFQTYSRR